MFGIDEGSQSARFLGFCYGVQRQGRLTRRFGAEYLHDSAFGIASHSEGHIQRNRTGGDNGHLLDLVAAHSHNGSFTEILLYFVEHCIEYFQLVCAHFFFFCHIYFLIKILTHFISSFPPCRFGMVVNKGKSTKNISIMKR